MRNFGYLFVTFGEINRTMSWEIRNIFRLYQIMPFNHLTTKLRNHKVAIKQKIHINRLKLFTYVNCYIYAFRITHMRVVTEIFYVLYRVSEPTINFCFHLVRTE